MQERAAERIWTLRLLGLESVRLDVAFSVVALLLLAASRFALLANGPWEQDEAIFARSVVLFEPALHFPHPPFFPGWIALGKVLAPVVGNPLLALQIVSSLASVLSLFPLAFLGRRVAPAPVALACVLAVQLLPGAWVFSVRAFTSIPAGFALFLAAAWVAKGLSRRALVPFSLLLAAGFLIRPALAPLLAIIGLVGICRARSWAWALIAVPLGGVAVAGAYYPVVRIAGGWQQFMSIIRSHEQTHVGSLADYSWRFQDLGLVAAFGGPALAIVIGILCLVGFGVWWRRAGWRSALIVTIVIGAFVASLLFLHVRTFPRYSAPLVMAVAPVLAAALSLVPWSWLATALVLAGGTGIAAVWLPVMVEQHQQQLPMWRAAAWACERAAVANGDWQVLGGRGGWAFVAYHDALHRASSPDSRVPEPDRWAVPMPRDPLAPHWLVVTEWWGSVLSWDGTREEASFEGVSKRLATLSQDRFLKAAVVADLPLQRGRWWPVETREDGLRFAWCSNRSALILPAVPPGIYLRLAVRPTEGEKALVIGVNHRLRATAPGTGKVTTVFLPPRALLNDQPNKISLDREEVYPPGGRDKRPLSAAIYDVVSGTYQPFQVSAADQEKIQALGIMLEGFHGPESFRDGVRGRWSKARGVIGLPVCTGQLELTLLAPRPGAPTVEVLVNGKRAGGPWVMSVLPQRYRVEIAGLPESSPLVLVELRTTPPYSPSLPDGKPSRTIGVVLSDLEFTPDQ